MLSDLLELALSAGVNKKSLGTTVILAEKLLSELRQLVDPYFRTEILDKQISSLLGQLTSLIRSSS